MATEAKRRAVAKYNQKNYKTTAIRWPIDFTAELRMAADAAGIPLAQYVKEAIEARMASEGYGKAAKE